MRLETNRELGNTVVVRLDGEATGDWEGMRQTVIPSNDSSSTSSRNILSSINNDHGEEEKKKKKGEDHRTLPYSVTAYKYSNSKASEARHLEEQIKGMFEYSQLLIKEPPHK